jgi:hypothetical protein
MEKMMTSFVKGSGKNTLTKANSKNAKRIPHHHLKIFIIGIPLLTPSRYA